MKRIKIIPTVLVSMSLISISACQTALRVVPGARTLPGGTVASLELTSDTKKDGKFAEALEFRRGSREEKIGQAIAQSNKLCAEYISSVSATERGLNTSLGVFSTLAHMGGILADGTGAKAAWGAYGAAADGIQGNVRKGIFKDNEPTILMAAMQTYRKEAYAAFLKKIDTGGEWEDTPFDLLVPMIEEYHASCTISNAIIQIQKSVSTPE